MARGERQVGGRRPVDRRLQGQAGVVARDAGRRVRSDYGLAKELDRLYSYASLLADQDTRDSDHQGKRQEMVQVAAAFSAAAAYVDPEILKAGKATIDKFVAAEPRLKPYRMNSTT